MQLLARAGTALLDGLAALGRFGILAFRELGLAEAAAMLVSVIAAVVAGSASVLAVVWLLGLLHGAGVQLPGEWLLIPAAFLVPSILVLRAVLARARRIAG